MAHQRAADAAACADDGTPEIGAEGAEQLIVGQLCFGVLGHGRLTALMPRWMAGGSVRGYGAIIGHGR
jgi:hypothetical protein